MRPPEKQRPAGGGPIAERTGTTTNPDRSAAPAIAQGEVRALLDQAIELAEAFPKGRNGLAKEGDTYLPILMVRGRPYDAGAVLAIALQLAGVGQSLP